jgi:hypothetical protein
MKKYHLQIVLILAFVLELGMMTFLQREFGHYFSAFLFFITSLLMGLAGIYQAFQKNQEMPLPTLPVLLPRSIIFYVTYILLVLISCIVLNKIIQNTPIEVAVSDIIPQVSVLVRRFLSGEFPYQVITGWGNPLYPTYLPLQWLPFVLTELLHLDYRWVSHSVFCAAVGVFGIVLLKKHIKLQHLLLLVILAFSCFFVIAIDEPRIPGVTIEPLIAGYYLLLTLSLFSPSPIVRAAAVLFCLLSRYSLLLWLPLYMIVVFFAESKKNAFVITALCLAGVVLIYILPFLRVDNTIFLKAYNYHSTAALEEWSGQPWQQPDDKPFHLFRGIGFASFFYDFSNGDLTTRLSILQKTHFILSVLTVAGLGLFYYKYRSKLQYQVYLLASFKIYLAIFLNFIQIPYNYLFLTLLICSLPILLLAFIQSGAAKDA